MIWQDQRIVFALEATQQAALLASKIQGELVSEAITKDDRSPVTVADFAAQAVVGYLLEKTFPGELLVGEERAELLRTRAEQSTLHRITEFVGWLIPGVSSAEVCEYIDRGVDDPGVNYWTLDPIDGTKGFLRGSQYACALAYVENGIVQLGVLGCPNLTPDLVEDNSGDGSLLIAAKGAGSWISPLKGAITANNFQALQVSSVSSPDRARLMRSYESGHTNTSQIEQFQVVLGGKADPVRMDSQVKYALLAAGEGEIYLRLLSADHPDYREKIWDQAAGSIVVEEAGGKVTDLDGKALDFSQGRTLKNNRGICATNGTLHDQALKAIQVVQA